MVCTSFISMPTVSDSRYLRHSSSILLRVAKPRSGKMSGVAESRFKVIDESEASRCEWCVTK